MITVGIDMGLERVKAVAVRDGAICGRGSACAGGASRAAAAESACAAALAQAGADMTQVKRVVATGKGKFDVSFAGDRVTEPVAAALAARFLCPAATTVMDVGADKTLAVAVGDGKLIDEFALNQKCSAGLGTFLKYMAERLALSQQEMDEATETDGLSVSDGCVVFAELDALSLLNDGVAPQKVAAAVTEAVAVRAATVFHDISLQKPDCVVLFGGLTGNPAFVRALEKYTGVSFVIPPDADYAGAVGAALFEEDE